MVTSSSQCFSAAVERIVRSQPHGYNKHFAKKIGISPQYLSDLLASRKFWPDEHKDKAAAVLGLSVSELLQIGQTLIETGQFFPYIKDVSALTPHSEDRSDWIMKRAGRDEGIGDVRFLLPAAVKVWAYGLIEWRQGNPVKKKSLCIDLLLIFWHGLWLLKAFIPTNRTGAHWISYKRFWAIALLIPLTLRQ